TQPGFGSAKSGSGRPIVPMMQASQSWLRHNPTGSRTGNSAGRCVLRKAKMCAVFVVVADVFREQPFQMTFIERNDVVKQAATTASNAAFRDAILPWAFRKKSESDWCLGANRRPGLATRTLHRDRRSETWEPNQRERSRATAGRYTDWLDVW